MEIGSESGPAAFLDTMLALSAEWGRVLAPHGSLCVELGDTYSGSGGAGGDYNADGLRDGQQRFSGSAARGDDWPLSKSKTMLDTLYPACLAYGANLLSGEVSPAGRWRIRNLIVWARPNPPVGALGDKFRPATSYITVACKSPRRWFDLDAVRAPRSSQDARWAHAWCAASTAMPRAGRHATLTHHPAGAPPLDWHADDHPEDGDWLWKMSPQGFAGCHYATFPLALPTRLIKAMCPERVCTVCGAPSERITETADGAHAAKPERRATQRRALTAPRRIGSRPVTRPRPRRSAGPTANAATTAPTGAPAESSTPSQAVVPPSSPHTTNHATPSASTSTTQRGHGRGPARPARRSV
jgi:hypothetical protein